jgi:hypothetical protein
MLAKQQRQKTKTSFHVLFSIGWYSLLGNETLIGIYFCLEKK